MLFLRSLGAAKSDRRRCRLSDCCRWLWSCCRYSLFDLPHLLEKPLHGQRYLCVGLSVRQFLDQSLNKLSVLLLHRVEFLDVRCLVRKGRFDLTVGSLRDITGLSALLLLVGFANLLRGSLCVVL